MILYIDFLHRTKNIICSIKIVLLWISQQCHFFFSNSMFHSNLGKEFFNASYFAVVKNKFQSFILFFV